MVLENDALLGDDVVPVKLPWLDRPGLLHLPSMTVIPPLSGGDDDDDKKSDEKTEDDKTEDKVDDKADDKVDDEDKVKPDDDWRAKSRKNEAARKKAEKERDELAAKLKQRDDEAKSEQEKAIDAAREAATTEVTTKYEAERRADRIENAVTKLSLKDIKIKGEDGKEITARFADPDDAQLRLDRALRNGEISYDDIYTDGKVDTKAVTDFLVELLEEHPRLRAADASTKKSKVDFDGGKGSGSGGKDLADMTPEEHAKRKGRRSA